MEKIGDMKFYTFEEVLDEQIGKKGTTERTLFEKEAKAKIDEYRLGEKLRKEREAQCITASQLAERVGVRRSQLTRLENGNGGSVSLLSKVCNALGFRLDVAMA